MDRNSVQDRCTESDYRQLFSSSAREFHELCFVLTGDEKLAAASFATALERTVKGGTAVFREWLRSWARRQLIKSCIAALRSDIESDARTIVSPQASDQNFVSAYNASDLNSSTSAWLLRALSSLDVLTRFVFVLRALEGYSARETGLLLDVGSTTVKSAYQRSIEVVALAQQRSDEKNDPRSGSIVPRAWKVAAPAPRSGSRCAQTVTG